MYNNKWIKKYVDDHNYKDKLDYQPIDNNCLAIIVETRDMPNLDWVCNTVKYHLNWKIRFYCSHNSQNSVSNVEKSLIPNNIEYSEIFKDIEFWRDIDQEHILVFQHDSFVMRSGIEEFLKYDYIGAPWYWAYGDHKDRRYKDLKDFQSGGNGGFSLRKRSVMMRIIENNPPDYEYEDMYFSNALSKDVPLEVKKRFAVESMVSPDPLGVHQITKYLNNEQIKNLLF